MISRGTLVLASVVALAGCTAASPPAAPASSAARAETGCHSRIETGPLPDWADTGFHGDTRVPHVFGAKGDIVAVLFGQPLTHGRVDGPTNKILWVSRPATGSPDPAASPNLVITATLDGTDNRVTREVTGGPGPSVVDVPRAGCWHLVLDWSGRTDTMDLVYAEG